MTVLSYEIGFGDLQQANRNIDNSITDIKINT